MKFLDLPAEKIFDVCRDMSIDDLVNLSAASRISQFVCSYHLKRKIADRNLLIKKLRGTWSNSSFSNLIDPYIVLVRVNNKNITVDQDKFRQDINNTGQPAPQLLQDMSEAEDPLRYPIYRKIFNI